jgi:predicted MFS family arabinose efflux permease
MLTVDRHHRRPPAALQPAGTYAWYIMLLLLLCQALSSLDARLPFILVEALKHDLSLSDTQIGVITGPAFSLTYAIFALPIARLSDRRARKYVIAAAIVIWSVFTAAGALTAGFATFAISRVGVALGEAALVPAAHSLVAAYMPVRIRPRAIAMIAIGVSLGAYAALAAGGWINDNYGWRPALRLVGVVGGVLVILVLATLKEPKRESDAARHNLPSGNIRSLLADPGMRNILIGVTGRAAEKYTLGKPFKFR